MWVIIKQTLTGVTMSESRPIFDMIDNDSPRYITEWDYDAAQRDQDFTDAFEESLQEYLTCEPLGSEERIEVVADGVTTRLSTVAYRNGLGDIGYVFEIVRKDLVLAGKIHPGYETDEVWPFFTYEILNGSHGDTLETVSFPDLKNIPEQTAMLNGREYANQVILQIFSTIVGKLERRAVSGSMAELDQG
jgi:hypothetical protein